MVLDGQQRLQGLFLSFKGLYDGKRVYLRIDRRVTEGDSGLHYGFDFLSDAEAQAEPAFVHVGQLVSLRLPKIDEFVGTRLSGVHGEGRKRAVEIVSTFVEEFSN